MMSFKKILFQAFMAAGLAMSSLSAQAWDGVITGKIVGIDSVAQVGNYDLRIYLDNSAAVCTGALDTSWGYANSSDANFKGTLSVLMMAYVAGKTVTIYTNKVNNYCQIGYIAIRG